MHNPSVRFPRREVECGHVVTPVAILPGLLKSQSKNQDKEPEITHKSTQSKVFRTLHVSVHIEKSLSPQLELLFQLAGLLFSGGGMACGVLALKADQTKR